MEEFRPANEADCPWLEYLLYKEGLPPEEHKFRKHDTWVWEGHGFCTFHLDKGVPHLTHFCLSRPKRTPENARRLAKMMVVKARGYGQGRLYIHSKKDYLDKLIKYFFKRAPFAVRGVYSFYEVEV